MHAGIYIHVPFCHVACHYCNFHFSTQLTMIDAMVDAIVKELAYRKRSFEAFSMRSIYFGGGTPSVLSQHHLKKIIGTCYTHYNIANEIECTIEANPEDIHPSTLIEWNQLGINRISLGIQSLNDVNLKFLNRNHTKETSLYALTSIKNGPIQNYSVDIIYGIHQHAFSTFKDELDTLLTFEPTHISAYNLTIEPKTAFGNWLLKNKITPVDETSSAEQFEYLIQYLPEKGYEQYEISNFCKPHFESQHNSSYWHNQPYIGVGPGAHSYLVPNRSANISNNALYIKYMEQTPDKIIESETLSEIDQYNEYILTRLRTKWGIALHEIQHLTESKRLRLEKLLLEYVDMGYIYNNNSCYVLTNKGKLFADEITLKLML
jgi:oxygen-independent coproporphyrinogen-3 oxidase